MCHRALQCRLIICAVLFTGFGFGVDPRTSSPAPSPDVVFFPGSGSNGGTFLPGASNETDGRLVVSAPGGSWTSAPGPPPLALNGSTGARRFAVGVVVRAAVADDASTRVSLLGGFDEAEGRGLEIVADPVSGMLSVKFGSELAVRGVESGAGCFVSGDDLQVAVAYDSTTLSLWVNNIEVVSKQFFREILLPSTSAVEMATGLRSGVLGPVVFYSDYVNPAARDLFPVDGDGHTGAFVDPRAPRQACFIDGAVSSSKTTVILVVTAAVSVIVVLAVVTFVQLFKMLRRRERASQDTEASGPENTAAATGGAGILPALGACTPSPAVVDTLAEPGATQGLCSVCLENRAKMVLRPCNHVPFCNACWDKAKEMSPRWTPVRCPICRKPVSKAIAVFFT